MMITSFTPSSTPVLIGVLMLSACGGGGGGGGSTSAPILADSADQVAIVGTAVANISFASSGGAIADYAITPSLSAGLSFNTSSGVISGTPTATKTATTYTVTASNVTGNDTATVRLTVNPVAPDIANAAAVVAATGTAIANISFVNSGGAIARYAISPALSAGLNFDTNTGVISGTPTATKAITTYTVTASNVTSSDTATVDLTVNLGAPNIANAAAAVATTGTAIADISFVNSGGAIESYAISPALSAGLNFDANTGVISGTPTATKAITTYTVTASNITGNDTATVAITVNLDAPSIAGAIAVVATTGTTIADISFVNGGGAIARYAISPALSAGLNFDTTTGVISGTPTATQAVTTYTVTARNVTGSDTATVRLTVNLAAPTNLVATPAGGAVGSATADAITLRWDAAVGATGYAVYRSTQTMAASTNSAPINFSGLYNATSTPVTGTTHTTEKLDGKTYYFLVTSTTVSVESDTSATQASVVPFATVTSRDTGRVWMSRNLGATQDCTRSADTACYGDLYQWGRAADGHQRIDRTPTTALAGGNCWDDSIPSVSVACTSLKITARATSISDTTPRVNFILNITTPNDWVENTTQDGRDADDSGALRVAAWANGGVNDICPAGFSVPTLAELRADTLDASTEQTVNSPAAAFSSFLKLPVAGFRTYNFASLDGAGGSGFLWTRSIENNLNPRTVRFSNVTEASSSNRGYGNSVRCIKVIAPRLANASAVTATSGNAITAITFANTGGAPATCTVSPELPTGLSINASTCTIAGTPSATQSAMTHTVTGSNTAGSDTATVSLTVN